MFRTPPNSPSALKGTPTAPEVTPPAEHPQPISQVAAPANTKMTLRSANVASAARQVIFDRDNSSDTVQSVAADSIAPASNVPRLSIPDTFAKILADAAEIINCVTENKSVTAANKKRIIELAKSITESTRLITPETASSIINTQSVTITTDIIRDTIKEEIGKALKRHPLSTPTVPPQHVIATTYAQAAAARNNSKKDQHTKIPSSLPSKPAIIVTPNTPAKTKQDAVEAWKKSISFRDKKYAPARIQTVSNNKLRIEFDNVEQRDETLKRLESSACITAEPARKLRPMIILKGISKDTRSEDLVDIIKGQNPEISGLITNEGDLVLRFVRNNKNASLYNAVLISNPKVYRNLMNMERVCVDHQKVRVDNFSPFLQCHTCYQFGHTKTKCTAHTLPCAHCGTTEHQIDNCPNKDNSHRLNCYNCFTHNIKFNTKIDTKHPVNSHSCPRLRAIKTKIDSRVDYGL